MPFCCNMSGAKHVSLLQFVSSQTISLISMIYYIHLRVCIYIYNGIIVRFQLYNESEVSSQQGCNEAQHVRDVQSTSQTRNLARSSVRVAGFFCFISNPLRVLSGLEYRAASERSSSKNRVRPNSWLKCLQPRLMILQVRQSLILWFAAFQ